MSKKKNTAILAVGKGITNVGDGNWAGWSGLVTVNDSTEEMFNFVTPQAMIVKNFQYYLNAFMDTHYIIGWNIKIDGITIVESRWKATDTTHFHDLDANEFVIPANSGCIIESYTNQAGPIGTFATLTLKESD